MIRIKRGSHTMSVTRGAFNAVYKPMGYTEMEEHKAPKTHEETDDEYEDADMDSDEDDEPELGEKPLNEMNFNELKEYATQLGIATAGMRTRRELKEAIQQAEQ